jgi:hypothetical protein
MEASLNGGSDSGCSVHERYMVEEACEVHLVGMVSGAN